MSTTATATTTRRPRKAATTTAKGEKTMTAAVLDKPETETVAEVAVTTPEAAPKATESTRTRISTDKLNAVTVEEINLDFDPFAARDAARAAGKPIAPKVTTIAEDHKALVLLAQSLDGVEIRTDKDGKALPTEGKTRALAPASGESVDMLVKLIERCASQLGQGKPVISVQETTGGPIVAFRAKTKSLGKGRPRKES